MLSYKQITQDGQAEITVKGSRFICTLKRVKTEEEANTFIQEIRKQHKKATHNCYAYVIGETDHIQKASDDGEPSRTAGVPMLDVLKKQELHFIAAVVTRYFGGTKLGTGGLIRAYGSAVSHAIHELGLILHTTRHVLAVTVPYTLSGKFEYFLSQSPYTILDTQYSEHVVYHCGVLETAVDTFKADVIEQFAGKLPVAFVTSEEIDLPLDTEQVRLDDHLFND